MTTNVSYLLKSENCMFNSRVQYVHCNITNTSFKQILTNTSFKISLCSRVDKAKDCVDESLEMRQYVNGDLCPCLCKLTTLDCLICYFKTSVERKWCQLFENYFA